MQKQELKSIPPGGYTSTPICLYTDSQGIILEASDAILHVIGKSQREITGSAIPEILSTSSRKKIEQVFGAAPIPAKGLLLDLELKAGRKKLPMAFTITPMKELKGKKKFKWESEGLIERVSSLPSSNKKLIRSSHETIKALKDSHDELREILENAAEVIVKFNASGVLLYTSPEFEKQFGYTQEEVLGKEIRQIVHSDDLSLFDKAMKQLLLSHLPVRDIICRYKRKDGQYRYLNTSAKFLFNEDGSPRFGVGLSLDITEQKETIKKLQASEQRYTAFLQNSSEGIWRIEIPEGVSILQPFETLVQEVSSIGYLAECNQAFARMYGYEKNTDILGAKLQDLLPIEDPSNLAYFASFVKSGFNLVNAESVEFDNKGRKVYFLNNLVGIIEQDRLLRIWGTQRDITEQKYSQELLQKSEEKYKIFIQQSSEAIWRMEGVPKALSEYTDDELVDAIYEHTFVVECNDVFAKIYGRLKASEMVGVTMKELVPDKNMESFSLIRQFVKSGFRLENVELMEMDGSGQPIYVMNSLLGIVENNHLVRVWGTQKDVTKLKEAEREIFFREKQYRTLAENVPVLIHRFDRNLRFTYVNKAVKETFNQPPDIFIGKTPRELGLEGPKWDILRKIGERVFTTGHPENFTFKIPSVSNPGKEYNLLLNLTPEVDENGQVNSLIAIANEITPFMRAQDELVYKDQLLSVIADITNEFLREEDYHAVVTKAIPRLGKVFNADSVCVFECHPDAYKQESLFKTFEWTSQEGMNHGEAEWTRIPSSSLKELFKEENKDAALEIFTATLAKGPFQSLLESGKIHSLLLVPILVQQNYWGFVMCKVKVPHRTWVPVEKDMLKTFSTSLASALERKYSEQVIQESETRFRQMADNAPVMIWVSDETDKTIYVNKSFSDYTGLQKEDVNDQKWSSLVHPEDQGVAIQEYDKLFKALKPVLLEYRLKTAKGEYRWVIDEALPRFLPDGTFMGYIGSVIDIHDRKLIEQKMRFQARVMQEVSEAIISIDLDYNVITWNKGAETIYGYTADEIVGKPMRDYVQLNYVNESMESSLEHLHKYGHWSGEIYFDRRDGKRIYMHSSVTFLNDENGKRIGYVGNNRDITDRRKSEEALRISEERYRSVVNAMGEGILLHDKDGRIIASNKSAESILGLNDDLSKRNIDFEKNTVAIHEDGTPFPAEQYPYRITLQTGRSLQGILMGIHKPNGTLTWITVNTEPIYYSDQRVRPDAVVASFVDITQRKMAEIELQENERQLREFSERINNILNSITDGFIAVDNDMKVFLWNRVFEIKTGIRSMDVIGKTITDIFPALDKVYTAEFMKALKEKRTLFQEYYSTRFRIWFEVSAFPSSQGLFIYFRDISRRKRQETLLALEKEALEMNARPQTSLKSITDFLLIGLETAFPGMSCSVLSLREDGKTIDTVSAPSLPEAYSKAIDGIEIGPMVGCCGTAMYTKQNTIVADISKSELWDSFRGLANKYNLKSCWSFPILSSQNQVLASFAIYHSQVKVPSAEELVVIERTLNILRVIIENKQSEEKIKISNERYLLATMATNDAIWDADLLANTIYWGEGFHSLFGYKAGYFADFAGVWESYIHPQDKARVVEGLNKFIESNSQHVWQDEYRFRKLDGKYVLVSDRGFLIYNQQGKVSRMVGSMQDITEKREMEKKLLRQQLNKQKLVAQAVVDAQERERSLIGKELHDNVNQILSTAKLYLEVAKNDNKERDSLIDMSTQSISDAINEIRAISRSLVPSSIGDLGLVESIQDLVESIKLTRKLNVEFYHHDHIDEILTEPQKLMLFRITQEQVNNVIKHANAKNLVIELVAEEDAVNISLADDGKGFDVELVKQNKGVGLSNITSRAELFNGKVDIITAPGKGCTLNIHVPISSNL